MATLLTKERQNDPAVLLTLCAVAVSAFILVFLSLLVSWTPHPAVFVHGVQGRYFLPIALILAYMTTANASASAASIAVQTSDKILLAALFLFSVLLVSQSTKERYFETAAHKAIPSPNIISRVDKKSNLIHVRTILNQQIFNALAVVLVVSNNVNLFSSV